jgi:hypothetical protein
MPAPRARFPRLRAPRQRKGSGRPLNSCPRKPPPPSGPARSTAPTLSYTSPDRTPSLSACSNAISAPKIRPASIAPSKTMTSPSSRPKNPPTILFRPPRQRLPPTERSRHVGHPPEPPLQSGNARSQVRAPGIPDQPTRRRPRPARGKINPHRLATLCLPCPRITTVSPPQARRRRRSLRPLVLRGRLPFVL